MTDKRNGDLWTSTSRRRFLESAAWMTGGAATGAEKEHKMPKVKTNKTAAKRFKISGTGKLMFERSHLNHA